MSRSTTPPIISARSARFSTAAHDEVELIYPFEGIEGHADNGKATHGYYPTDDYKKRQDAHGKDIYPEPEPFTDGHFKR